MTDPWARYEAALEPERRRVSEGGVLARLLRPGCDDRLFARWFLRFSAHGVHLSGYEGWWLPDEGAGRDRNGSGPDPVRALLESVQATADWWRGRYGTRPDVAALLRTPPPAGAEFYVRLCENVAGGEAPLRAAAIGHETARLMATAGPGLLAGCRRVFGGDAGCAAFLAAQVAEHAGRLDGYRRRLASGLAEDPASPAVVVGTGKSALASFSVFLAECWDLAAADLAAADLDPADLDPADLDADGGER
uniref:hypothetical protein n=1 Tax=Nonomuraea pusilla TaxID=46177 RepID=UPI0006E27FDB|nr:hypothetical protein [Nonomuraea pusilla]